MEVPRIFADCASMMIMFGPPSLHTHRHTSRCIDGNLSSPMQGSNLRGKEFNLTLHWHVMPKTGKMFADKIVMTGYRLPDEYR